MTSNSIRAPPLSAADSMIRNDVPSGSVRVSPVTATLRCLADATPEDPALDVAVSHALLTRVAARELPATARLYRPGPTVAFGRLDRLRDGFDVAVRAAREHGFAPVLRNAGGHAAAYTSAALVYEEITPQPRLAVELRERFDSVARLLAGALASLGADARIGELDGEYCPGQWSVHAGGAVKLVGIAQRVVKRAALVSAVIVVGDGSRVRAVLRDVNVHLGLEWEPRTAGALDDVVPGAGVDDVRAAVLARHGGLEPATLDEDTRALARELVARHRLE